MSLTLTLQPPGESPLVVAQLPEGDKAISATIAAMRRVVMDATHSGLVRGVARNIEAAPGDDTRFPWKVEAFLRAAVKYQDDPPGQEMLRMPEALIDAIDTNGQAAGDCDDVAMLGASLLAVAGYRPVFIVVGRTPRTRGGRLEHVYFGYMKNVAAGPGPQNVVPFDPQERKPPGIWQDAYARLRIHRVFP